MGLSENRVFLSIHCFIIASFCWFIWLCLKMNYCKWSIALNSLIGNMMIKHRTWWYDTRFSNKPTCLGQVLDLEISDELDGPTKTFTLKSPKRALRILVKSIIPFINPNVGEIICYINPFFCSWNHHISWIFLVISTLNARKEQAVCRVQPEMSVKCHPQGCT
jgi:hypothetical protein